MGRTRGGGLAALAALLVAALGALAPLPGRADTGPGACAVGGPAVTFAGTAAPEDARTYRMLGVDVGEGTTGLRLSYGWAASAPSTPATGTTFDLGLWQGGADPEHATFRGWSGSREGLASTGPIEVSRAASTTRGYVPGDITPGRWWVELGIAAVAPGGASWHVEVRCLGGDPGPPFVPQPITAPPTVRRGPAWYHGDFHFHGRHSNHCASGWIAPETPSGCPVYPSIHEQARAAGLDFAAVTDYVTTAHWGELGAAQTATADFLWWPSREVITYYGHATVFGETPSGVDHRHGLGGVTIGDIQLGAVDDDALFGVAHPTIFPGPVFRSFCRGCEWELSDQIDWAKVATVEVLTGPVLSDLSDAGGPGTASQGLTAEQPFVATAIDFWEDLLRRGYKVAPVSGSDSKGVEATAADRNRKGYGSSATAVYADNLSVAALGRAVLAGRTYVRTRGVDESPLLALTVTPVGGGAPGTFGSVLHADAAIMTVQVSGGDGQVLRVTRNGTPVLALPIVGSDATLSVPIFRAPGEEDPESPLGTFWRVDTLDARSLTTIGNAVFLDG